MAEQMVKYLRYHHKIEVLVYFTKLICTFNKEMIAFWNWKEYVEVIIHLQLHNN